MQKKFEVAAEAQNRAWQSFEVVQGAPDASFLLLCDHATNLLPPEFGTLGLAAADLDRHIAYDIGALPVALAIGQTLKATVIYTRFSRLLIDPNRGEDDPTLVMQISDGAVVPGNVKIHAAARERRIAEFYAAYHSAISAEIDAMIGRSVVPAIVSIHSFTEAWRGNPRKWRAAILWDKDPRLAPPLLHELRAQTGCEIGDNEPYSGHLRNDTIFRHATSRGLPNALIEIRQDLIREAKGQQEWGGLIADCLKAIVEKEETAAPLRRIDYYGSHTDICPITHSLERG